MGGLEIEAAARAVGKVDIFIRPWQFTLASPEHRGQVNTVEGVVERILPLGGNVTVDINGPLRFTVQLPKRDMESRLLECGDKVLVSFPKDAVQILASGT
ncbi:MAG: TOBE domain-containing protein [Kiritimatiellae bacterium]|nr:TOBE domain-containing protein [Kiritimatiellia bacterium]